jgi:hypothetical protein
MPNEGPLSADIEMGDVGAAVRVASLAVLKEVYLKIGGFLCVQL